MFDVAFKWFIDNSEQVDNQFEFRNVESSSNELSYLNLS